LGDSWLIWQRRGYLDTVSAFQLSITQSRGFFVVVVVVVVKAELIAGSLLTLKSLLVPFGLNEGMGAGLSDG